MRETIEPELLTAHVRAAAEILESEGDSLAVNGIYDVQSKRIGPTLDSLLFQIKARRRACLPIEETLDQMLLLAQGDIFDATAHRMIAECLLDRPDLAEAFPAVVLDRAAHWAGVPAMPRLVLPFSAPADARQAATQLARLAWALEYQLDDPGLGRSVRQVIDAFPTSRQAVAVAIQFIISGPNDEIELDPPRVARMIRAYPEASELKILRAITTAEQARRLKPIIASRMKGNGVYRDLLLHRVSPGQWTHTPDGPAIRSEFIRVIVLAGLNPEW